MPSTSRRAAFVAAFLGLGALLGGCAITPLADERGERDHIVERVRALLRAYAENDQATVLAMIDPSEFSLFGSDVAEVVHTPAELKRLMDDDFALWGSARFGDVRDLDVRVGDDLATAFFDVPFSAGGAAPVVVRLTTTWRKVRGQWLLTQGANAVPTSGSSAREILHRQGRRNP